MIHLTIQGIEVEVAEGTTVLEAARKACDSLEAISDKEFWPVPTYSEILFYV